MQSAADTLGVELLFVEASRPDDFEGAFAKIVGSHADAVLVGGDAFFFQTKQRLLNWRFGTKYPQYIQSRHSPLVADWRVTERIIPRLTDK